MKAGKFCFNCGTALEYSGTTLECPSCRAVYHNLIISECEFAEGEARVVELSIAADITFKLPAQVAQHGLAKPLAHA
ncbi:MAG: hypothetical protein GXO66_02890 [Euryarchaeota archaeon]|nr:hypothetical protein [Euryarchaeota archaeon]